MPRTRIFSTFVDAILAALQINGYVVKEHATPVRYRHDAIGFTYTEIGRGILQSTNAIHEGRELVAYRDDQNEQVWFRPADEFDDGRFTRLD